MATPVSNSVPLTGNPFIDGLVQGSSWQFGGGPHTLTYSLDLNFDGPTTLWTMQLTAAVADAFSAWSAVANVQFVQIGTPNTQAQNQSSAGIALALDPSTDAAGILLGLGIFPDPAFADQLLSVSGYTRNSGTFPVPNPEGDIVYFTANNQFNPGGAHGDGPSSIGFSIVLHEIGHALGLKHPDDDGGNDRPTFAALGIAALDSTNYTLMSNNDPHTLQAFTTRHSSTPMPLDILAIQQIYGANLSYHAGDDIYVPQDDQTYTIWDAGGIDTIDGNNYVFAGNFGVVIDLCPGNFSHVNYPPNLSGSNFLLGIAYGATIENATGTFGTDVMIGNDANNVLNGFSGADTMTGGKGDDTYVVWDSGDLVIENPGEGMDLVQSRINYVLPASVENLTLIGSTVDQQWINISGTGNELDNVISGDDLGNMLSGLGGDDQLFGGAGDDTLVGGAGLDFLHGGPGLDELRGGASNDTYVISDAAPAGPTSLNLKGDRDDFIGGGETLFFNPTNANLHLSSLHSFGGMVDSVNFDVNDFAFGSSHFWSLQFIVPGTGILPGTYLDVDVNFNPGTNLQISGDGRGGGAFGSFTILAAQFDYTTATPTLLSFAVTFEQHSSSATAALRGGFYYSYALAPSSITDSIVEQVNEGIDTVQSSVDFTLPANVENLTIIGSANLNGGGNNLDNVFISNSGIDTLAGGLGNDTYYLNNAGDVVTENLGEGIDTVVAGFSYTLVGTNLENVTLTGSSNLTATGNAFDNVLTSNTGIDTLTGGMGDDIYVLNNAADTVVENPGEGTDTVATSFDYLLTVGSNLENVTLFGSDPVNATGDGLDNVITGNSAPNVLTGGLGNDTLIGGFALDTALFSGLMSSYTITHTGTLGTVTGPDGTDNFSSVERLQFDDQSLSFVVPKNDFNGDGHSDILWHNASGQLALWQMNGATLTSAGAVAGGAQVSADWHIATITDFSGDGTTDILWRNNSGAVAEWNMNGTAIASAGLVASGAAVSSDWQIAGVGDFGGDGKSDILWHNTNGQLSMWQMDGSTLLSAGTVVSIPTAWQIAAVADFDGDGKSDILWRHSSGMVAEWNMNGMALASGGAVAGGAVVTSDWQIAGVGDFGGDGKNDILWQNTNGQLAIWQMDGSTLLSAGVAVGGAAVSADWHLAGVADFNGDDKSDILWRNDNGVVAEWNMNGHTMAQGGVVNNGTPVSTDWILNAT